jgi:hypothetical protein
MPSSRSSSWQVAASGRIVTRGPMRRWGRHVCGCTTTCGSSNLRPQVSKQVEEEGHSLTGRLVAALGLTDRREGGQLLDAVKRARARNPSFALTEAGTPPSSSLLLLRTITLICTPSWIFLSYNYTPYIKGCMHPPHSNGYSAFQCAHFMQRRLTLSSNERVP